MLVAGIETYLLVSAGAVLVVAIAVLLIRKTGGMRRRPSHEEGFEGRDMGIDMSDKPKSIDTDEVQKFKAKVDQLSTALNLEREKVRAKEEQIKEHEKSYENELLKVSALKDEIPFLRKKIGELQEESAKVKEKFSDEIEKVKNGYEEKIQKLENKIEELKDGFKVEKEDVAKKHKSELSLKDREIRDIEKSSGLEKENLKKELLSERQDIIKSYEDKILEVKRKTKETIQRLIDEKDGLIDRLKDDSEKLEDEADRLKERIRLLEVDRL